MSRLLQLSSLVLAARNGPRLLQLSSLLLIAGTGQDQLRQSPTYQGLRQNLQSSRCGPCTLPSTCAASADACS